jgi:hypothetical protein
MTNGYQLLEATDGNTQGDVSPLIFHHSRYWDWVPSCPGAITRIRPDER